jgi:hypothetical protein
MDSNTATGMKTPMQEHIEWMQEKLHILVEYRNMDLAVEVDECIQHAESMLKKEKQMVKDAFNFGGEYNEEWDKAAEQYYDETYEK